MQPRKRTMARYTVTGCILLLAGVAACSDGLQRALGSGDSGSSTLTGRVSMSVESYVGGEGLRVDFEGVPAQISVVQDEGGRASARLRTSSLIEHRKSVRKTRGVSAPAVSMRRLASLPRPQSARGAAPAVPATSVSYVRDGHHIEILSLTLPDGPGSGRVTEAQQTFVDGRIASESIEELKRVHGALLAVRSRETLFDGNGSATLTTTYEVSDVRRVAEAPIGSGVALLAACQTGANSVLDGLAALVSSLAPTVAHAAARQEDPCIEYLYKADHARQERNYYGGEVAAALAACFAFETVECAKLPSAVGWYAHWRSEHNRLLACYKKCVECLGGPGNLESNPGDGSLPTPIGDGAGGGPVASGGQDNDVVFSIEGGGGPVAGCGGGPGGFDDTPPLNCHAEQWEISYDGGHTWEPIIVQVCELAE